MENKPGEKTPEEYLNENGLDYNSLEMLLLRKEDISIALELARKSEREKVIRGGVEKIEKSIETWAKTHPTLYIIDGLNIAKTILNNLK
jgi:hypothetical protein